MNALLAIAIGVLVTAGTFQLLSRELFRVPFGIYLLLNASNLLVLSMAASTDRAAPLAQIDRSPQADPLVQAMVLTAIIIGFGISTFLLMLTGRLASRKGSLDTSDMRHWRG